MAFNVCVVIGARPNYIKAWPILRQINVSQDWKAHLVHSGQHYDKNLATDLLRELDFPSIDTQLTLSGRTNASSRYSSLHNNFRDFFSNNSFDAVIVFGDVNTTVASTLAAKSTDQFVVHVESGLRSFDVTMPEEINRIIVDNWSDLLITTEESANQNLAAEGFQESSVAFCGNPMIETLLRKSTLWRKETHASPYTLVTIHRAETIHSKEKLARVLEELRALSAYRNLLLPLHPATKNQIIKFGLEKLLTEDNIQVSTPQTYLNFLNAMWNSDGIVTDSGGVQEEAVFMKKKVVTLRPNTERPSTIDTGYNTLMPLEDFTVTKCLEHFSGCGLMGEVDLPLWDSNVAHRILENLRERISK